MKFGELLEIAKHHPWYQRNDFKIQTKADLYRLLELHPAQNLTSEPIYWSPSSGTTNVKPLFFPSLRSENTLQRQMLSAYLTRHGILRSNDVFLNLFPTGSMGRSLEIFNELAENCGATPLPVGAHPTNELAWKIRNEFQPNVLGGMPSRLLDLAQSNPNLWQPERIIFGGEALTLGRKEGLRWAFGKADLYGLFGSAEAGVFGFSLPENPNVYYIPKSIVHIEIVPTDAKSIGGELVITNLLRQAFPLIRYNTGDVVTLLDETSEMYIIEFQGRSSGSFQIAGEVVPVNDLIQGLQGIQELQIILSYDVGRKIDMVKVSLVVNENAQTSLIRDSLKARLCSDHQSHEVQISFVGLNDLIRKGYGQKAPLIIDNRVKG